MIPLKTIEDLISKHSILEKELSSGEVDKKLFAEKSKEYSDLNEVINDARKYFYYEGEKRDLEKILKLQNFMQKKINLRLTIKLLLQRC
jgi:peptide chain release factor 1